MQTTARRADDGSWVLNGTKMFITQGSVGGFCVVLAHSNPNVSKQRGITAFVVEHGTPGFSASKHLEKLVQVERHTCELTLEDVRVPDENRVGEVDHGFIDTMQILDRGPHLNRRHGARARLRRCRHGRHLREGSQAVREVNRRVWPSSGCSPT